LVGFGGFGEMGVQIGEDRLRSGDGVAVDDEHWDGLLACPVDEFRAVLAFDRYLTRVRR
jgi:hypothetical protein